METMLLDFRYALRMLKKNPGFTFVTILTLALGIGATTAIFDVVYEVLLRPLPYDQPNQIVQLREVSDRGHRMSFSDPNFDDLRSQNHSFEGMAEYAAEVESVAGGSEPTRTMVASVSQDFFPLMHVHPLLGRGFLPENRRFGTAPVALVSYEYWRQYLGGVADLSASKLIILNQAMTVVGVLPAQFRFPDGAEIWVPRELFEHLPSRTAHNWRVIARLRSGVDPNQAHAELVVIARQIKQQFEDVDMVEVDVSRLQDALTGNVRTGLWMLMGAVGFLLLIACANVANLMLARAATREREIAVRATLGAGRRRILRQLLTESALMALMGGALGIAVAYGGIHLLRAGLPPAGGRGQIPHAEWIGIDGTVLGFTLFVSLLTGIIFGLAPAIQISRSELFESLKEGSRGSTAGRRSHFIQSSLVVSEVALSLMLLVGAGVLIRSFFLIMSDSLGFDPSNVLTMQIFLSAPHYPKAQQVNDFYQRVIEGAGALPGVKSASAANFLPLTGWSGFCDFDIAGRATPPSGEHFTGQYRVADWRYLQTMGISVKQGRDLVASDGADTQSVALINEALARRYWPNPDLVGQQIRLKFPDTRQPWDPEPREGWLTIVGIVSDVRDWEWGEQKVGQIYLPYTQNASRIMHLVVRSEGDPQQLVSGVRSVVNSVDPNQPVTDARSMDDYLAASVSRRRLSMLLLILFAGVATVLAAVGIYGVMAYAVTQRSHEIGIRMALGAEPNDVLRMVVSDGMKLAGIGLVIGIAASYAAVHYLASQLYGVKAKDPLTVLCVSVGLVLVAISACYFPARRATKVDPLEALRYE